MSVVGGVSLGIAFFTTVASIGLLLISAVLARTGRNAEETTKERLRSQAHSISRIGYLGVIITFVALTVCCGVLIFCFVTSDYSLQYVAEYHSSSTSSLALLFKISGLWAGREGSLLLWAWLISLFGSVVALKNIRKRETLDNMAILVIQIVLLAFVAVLLFSTNNYPFTLLDPVYFNSDGSLKSYSEALTTTAPGGSLVLNASLVQGMSVYLEHWAMAIHPPTLFIGYAGLTVPFAYAMAAVIVNDPSKKWVERSRRYALFSWILLGIGIGLGAIWAYMDLNFGGYWGWDAVENASLLPWILCAALIHSFTVYRQRNAFKRWAIMCASLTFSFVIVGTFITRSGVLQNSVHTFAGDSVSLVLFLALILLSVLVGIVGILIRWKSFADKDNKVTDLSGSFFSKDVAYYFNNVLLLISALILTYLTVSSALPSWMPFGGQDVTKTLCPAIARPLTILYCLIMTVGPLLSWTKTEGRKFFKKALIPGIGALVVFALLMVYFVIYLKPSYDAIIAAGGSSATTTLAAGAPLYYFIITIVGFLIASLLFFNSLVMLGRVVRSQAKATGQNPFKAFFTSIASQSSRFGGFLAHLSIAVLLVGLIGSSMYVTQKASTLTYDSTNDTIADAFVIQDYRLVYQGTAIQPAPDNSSAIYTATFDVYKGDSYVGKVTPQINYIMDPQQLVSLPSTTSQPLEDLYVIFRGFDENNNFLLTAWVNPLITFVWVGFGLLMLGTIIAFFGPTQKKKKKSDVTDGH